MLLVAFQLLLAFTSALPLPPTNPFPHNKFRQSQATVDLGSNSQGVATPFFSIGQASSQQSATGSKDVQTSGFAGSNSGPGTSSNLAGGTGSAQNQFGFNQFPGSGFQQPASAQTGSNTNTAHIPGLASIAGSQGGFHGAGGQGTQGSSLTGATANAGGASAIGTNTGTASNFPGFPGNPGFAGNQGFGFGQNPGFQGHHNAPGHQGFRPQHGFQQQGFQQQGFQQQGFQQGVGKRTGGNRKQNAGNRRRRPRPSRPGK